MPPDAIELEDGYTEPLPAQRVYRAVELLVWQHPMRGVQTAVPPSYTHRPNPALVGDLVVASIFAPGQILSLDARTGTRRWRLKLPYYSTMHVYGSAPYLYGGTSKSLFALDAESGKICWEFAPYGHEREHIYSSPVVAEGRLFIGDRRGLLHCLDAKSGRSQWSTLTSRAENNQVNGTPLVHEDRVVVATNAPFTAAYDVVTGRELWKRRLARGSIYEVLPYRGMVLIRTTQTVYALSLENGRVEERWTWPRREIKALEVADTLLLVTTSDGYSLRDAPRGWKPPWPYPCEELRAFDGHRERWRTPYPAWGSGHLRWGARNGVIYESGYLGLGLVDPNTGHRLATIHDFGRVRWKRPVNHTSPPSADGEHLYVLADNGTVAALRKPV